MDQRMVEFIRALRAAGIRISISESQDAMFGVNEIGIVNLRAVQRYDESYPGQRTARPADI